MDAQGSLGREVDMQKSAYCQESRSREGVAFGMQQRSGAMGVTRGKQGGVCQGGVVWG